ncbi:hypothetical protein DFJ73DRAFT_772997 [Zopfochytrium polystomum]|nr:hypothetical protein DFJ73DRAFT_772997 [Zopfochytrium polystomum]
MSEDGFPRVEVSIPASTSFPDDAACTQLKILQLNALATRLADRHAFPFVPPHVLSPSHRFPIHLAHIHAHAPDIITLQEVEPEDHDSVFTPALQEMGYAVAGVAWKLEGGDGCVIWAKKQNEATRLRQAAQLIDAVASFAAEHAPPGKRSPLPVLLAGDFNSTPDVPGGVYERLTGSAKLPLCSAGAAAVAAGGGGASEPRWSTWKRRNGAEGESKHTIDYVFYSSPGDWSRHCGLSAAAPQLSDAARGKVSIGMAISAALYTAAATAESTLQRQRSSQPPDSASLFAVVHQIVLVSLGTSMYVVQSDLRGGRWQRFAEKAGLQYLSWAAFGFLVTVVVIHARDRKIVLVLTPLARLPVLASC